MNKISPLISIIIPAYNHEKFIGQAVASVLHQSYENLELIVIDDGSTDKTADVIGQYHDKRMTYIFQENEDAPNTINRGLSLANGDYISILNSDDVYDLTRIQRLLHVQQTTGAACIFTDVQPISDTGDKLDDPRFWLESLASKKSRVLFFLPRSVYRLFKRQFYGDHIQSFF
jgi:glycosyltransferase involved in cell wall biosynthesis